MNRLILLTSAAGVDLHQLLKIFESESEIEVVSTLEQLKRAKVDESTSLLSFGSGLVVPKEQLSRFEKPSYNLHAASPEFPGRDPHHYAIYQGVAEYGATLHIMSEKVDAGPIVAVARFNVMPKTTPEQLLRVANEVGLDLLRQTGPKLLSSNAMEPLHNIRWGAVKTKRSDLEKMAKLSVLIGPEEFERRYHAFDGGSHNNLNFTLYGHTFRIDKSPKSQTPVDPDFFNFTESAFRKLIRQLKARQFHFEKFGYMGENRHVLWRHDVDTSVHRALALARIEADEGVFSTYFINPRSFFYNIFEPTISTLIEKIQSLGHEIGLHFDGSAASVNAWQLSDLEAAIAKDQLLLENVTERSIRTMSWHNPDMSNLLEFDDERVSGLINAYSKRLRENYVYCSDSNGYWRFKSMGDVIDQNHLRLHLLTHPDWWTPEPMSPSEKINRAILGRARRNREQYDRILQQGGRQNRE